MHYGVLMKMGTKLSKLENGQFRLEAVSSGTADILDTIYINEDYVHLEEKCGNLVLKNSSYSPWGATTISPN